MANKIAERCSILRNLIPPSANILYFHHVPKTAGTHLAITLQESHKVNVFSLDATDEGFANRVQWYRPERPTFVRAHLFWTHAYAYFLRNYPNSKVFSVLRSPYALHFSMASMIRDRVLKAFTDNSEADGCCLEYIGNACTEFSRLDPLGQLAVILSGDRYKTEFASIYTNYFRHNEGHEPNPLEACSMMPIEAVDQFIKFLLGPTGSNQKRRNQTRISSSTTSTELLNSGILELIQGCIPTAELETYRKLKRKIPDLNMAELTSVLTS